jgi:hypothetical protein
MEPADFLKDSQRRLVFLGRLEYGRLSRRDGWIDSLFASYGSK